MGYSTQLYAVDIGHLKKLCTKDFTGAAAKVIDSCVHGEQRDRPVDYRKGPKVFLNYKSEISVNGELLSVEAFKALLVEPRWRGMMLYLHQENPPDDKTAEGEFQEIGSFASFLYGLGNWFVENGTRFTDQFCGIEWCNRLTDFDEIEAGLFDVPTSELIRDIFNRKFRYPKMGADYGYALEAICEIIGIKLGSIGTDRLRSLKLKTPLSKIRSPVKLPRREDFPYISCLDHQQAVAELERIKAVAKSKAPEIEAERQRFTSCLDQAVESGQGVVGFYY